jgi:tRNA nucleotidyltransferase (CCA-adding enzyme)
MATMIPAAVLDALALLQNGGYDAYLVGGCVRSLLLGVEPKDYDLATSAEPDAVLQLFHDYKTIPVGLQHGTVLVIIGGLPIEITTFRVDGSYTDARRPDQVWFTGRLEDDLSRRDLTINAMAWAPDPACPDRFDPEHVIDPFGGRADLAAGRIRCVGAASARLREDALRILRALRFAAVLGFHLETQTAAALRQLAPMLRQIAAERIMSEFSALICGIQAGPVLAEYWDVWSVFIPELQPMRAYGAAAATGLDLAAQAAQRVAGVAPVLDLRLAALLLDVGKPVAGPDHQRTGAELAGRILTRLRSDSATRDRVVRLIQMSDTLPEPTLQAVRRWLYRQTLPLAVDLCALKKADILAGPEDARQERLLQLGQVSALIDRIVTAGLCYQLSDLAVDGQDLIQSGLPRGRKVGQTLAFLLDQVIDGRLANEKQALLAAAQLAKRAPDRP